MTDPVLIRLSATSIARFKACPERFYFADVLGLRIAEDPEARRMGTNWHGVLETYRTVLDGHSDDEAFEAAVDHLNEAYAGVPLSKTDFEWAIEREILLALFIGYCWRWQDDEIQTVGTEIGFKLPLHHPKTGLPLSKKEVIRLGKIDRVVVQNGMLLCNEYKTAKSDISPTSDYWRRLKLNTQVSMYDLALHDMIEGGELQLGDLPVGGCLYDVVRKPSISPKMLTQADTKEFLATGIYHGEAIEITPEADGQPPRFDGWETEFKPGAKDGTCSMRETPTMFRARLIADIMERPDYYYARREVVRTAKERQAFRSQLYSIYRSMRYQIESGHFYKNEDQCDQYGGCDYQNPCWDEIDVTTVTPAGMKRIFTPLTVQETD